MERRKQACHNCTIRKVKCDRFIPCGTCIKRGQEKDCIESSSEVLSQGAIITHKDDVANILPLWQSYEHWIVNIGLLKTKSISLQHEKVNLEQDLNAAEFWMNYLREEASFDLLNYSIENLGPLYFSSVGDINDLFVRLEQYWVRRRDHENEGEGSCTPDDYYWDSLIWAVFTLTLYYASPEKISEILKPEPICDWLNIEKQHVWSETLQMTVYQGFLKCCLTTLVRTNYLMYPNVKLIQIFQILYNTTLPYDSPALTNNLIVQSIQTTKMFNLTNFRLYTTDDTAMGISKQIFSKIWYKLCFIDYLQASPSKCIDCHTEIPSLFQFASVYASYGSNVYQTYESFEMMCWKIISIDRDLEKTSDSTQRPLMKTIDAAKRELEILNEIIKKDMKKKEKSTNSLFEEFILKMLVNSVKWKIEKMYLIYYQTSNSMEMLVYYTKEIIRLLVINVNNERLSFNKFPYILNIISRMIGFLTFHQIFEPRPDIAQLIDDLKELITTLPVMLGNSVNKLGLIITRLESLSVLWDRIQVVESKGAFIHPIFKILQNDILFFSKFTNKIPLLIRGMNDFGGGAGSGEIELDEGSMQIENDVTFEENNEFNTIITAFQQEHNILEIIS